MLPVKRTISAAYSNNRSSKSRLRFIVHDLARVKRNERSMLNVECWMLRELQLAAAATGIGGVLYTFRSW